ncbi:protein FAR1-RELATED SEQUENCE 5-like [Silene latifolia]|uniref:protein FAR1-RELATED SEQUENCE 5-like n=1 Tax=Silene latifolia TaxID=37657 RepID=UPI003D781206
MGQQQPQCIITDQCPGIKKACPNVLKNSVHKYCMWHIMQKVLEMVGRAICNDTDFMTDINVVVWDVDLEPEEFEQNWQTVIEAHGMQNNRWLKYVFSIRQKWIPAYFRDLPLGFLLRITQRSESSNSYFKRFESHFGTLVEFWMRYNSTIEQQRHSQRRMDTANEHSCLLRITQRSESSNNYFKRFESHFGTLVEFWMRYNSTIEQQRHSQRRMDTANEHSMLDKVGPMKVEMHASLVYTHPIFTDFQKEVKHAICSMGVGGLTTVGIVEYHDVRDGLKHRNFRVEFNIQTNESKCACKLFERHGIVCRHILWVWNDRQVYKIPEPYVLARWTKKSYRPIIQDETGNVIEDIDEADIKKAEMSKVWSDIYATVGVMDTYATVKQTKQLQKTLKHFRENITGPIEPKTKSQEIEDLLGITVSNDIDL